MITEQNNTFKNLISIIEACSERGAFHARELTVVGNTYDDLVNLYEIIEETEDGDDDESSVRSYYNGDVDDCDCERQYEVCNGDCGCDQYPDEEQLELNFGNAIQE